MELYKLKQKYLQKYASVKKTVKFNSFVRIEKNY